MSEFAEKTNDSARNCDLSARDSPIVVLCRRQRNEGSILCRVLFFLFLFFLVPVHAFSFDGVAGRLILLYALLVHPLLVVSRVFRSWRREKVEPLLMTSMGSFRIIQGIWLSQMTGPACLLVFILGIGGLLCLVFNTRGAELFILAGSVVASGFLTSLAIWAGLRGRWTGVVYGILLFFLIRFWDDAFMGGGYGVLEVSARSVRGDLGEVCVAYTPLFLDACPAYTPLFLMFGIGTYVLWIFAAGHLSLLGKVEPLAFRKAMLSTVLLPFLVFVNAIFSVRVSVDYFHFLFYCAEFFLCLCFAGDAVHPWIRNLETGRKVPKRMDWGRRLFLRQGWQSGALLLIVLSVVTGGLFDLAAHLTYQAGSDGLVPGYAVYALLMACNCLFFCLAGMALFRKYAGWGLACFLLLGLYFVNSPSVRAMAATMTGWFLPGLVPLLNLPVYVSGPGATVASALFILGIGILYGIRSYGYWAAVRKGDE